MIQTRTLVVAIEAILDESRTLAPVVVAAMRAYADAIEKGDFGKVSLETMQVDANTTIRTLHFIDDRT